MNKILFFLIMLLGWFIPMGTGVLEKETLTVQKAKADSTIDEDYVSQKITLMKPSATPLDTIMRAAGVKIKIDSFKTEFYAVDTRPLTDTVKTAYTKPDDGDLIKAIAVDNTTMWTVDDTLKSKSALGADGKDATFIVLSIDAANSTLTLQPLNGVAGSGANEGKVVLPSLPEDTLLVRHGQSKYETDATTTPFGILPVKDYNYCQIFMAQVEQSTYQKMHGKEVRWEFSDLEALNIYDMRSTMELSFLDGYRYKFYDYNTNEEKYSTGGVRRSVTKALEYGTGGTDRSVTKAQMIDWTKEIFCGNSGSDQRVMFVGNVLAASLMKVNDVTRQLDAASTEVRWGITFRKIESNFGVLLVKHHPIFDLIGDGDLGLVLDINNVEKHIFQPTQITTLDLKKPGLKNADASVITEASCLVLRYPDTHAAIKPKA